MGGEIGRRKSFFVGSVKGRVDRWRKCLLAVGYSGNNKHELTNIAAAGVMGAGVRQMNDREKGRGIIFWCWDEYKMCSFEM